MLLELVVEKQFIKKKILALDSVKGVEPKLRKSPENVMAVAVWK